MARLTSSFAVPVSEDEDCRIGRCHGSDLVEDTEHAWTLCEHVREAVPISDLVSSTLQVACATTSDQGLVVISDGGTTQWGGQNVYGTSTGGSHPSGQAVIFGQGQNRNARSSVSECLEGPQRGPGGSYWRQ